MNIYDSHIHIRLTDWLSNDEYTAQKVEHLFGKLLDSGRFLFQLMLHSAGNNNHYSITQMQILTPGILGEHMSQIIQFHWLNPNL